MSCLSRISHYTAAILVKTTTTIHLLPKPTFTSSLPSSNPSLFLPPSKQAASRLHSVLGTFRLHCYSSSSSSSSHTDSPVEAADSGKKKKKKSRKLKLTDKTNCMEERDSFFVVRKGDIVGVYKNFSDCQAQVGSSILDAPVSIYKGSSLPKDSETYLLSHGLHNALYTIRAADLKEDLFGPLFPCSLQQPSSSKDKTYVKDATKKRAHGILELEFGEVEGSTSTLTDISKKQSKVDSQIKPHSLNYASSCILEFDGASKGNPGQAGAGAVLRADDGSLICRLREGLGVATCNAAEYRAIILGLKYALQKGYTMIRVQGDSKLVCMQIQGLWKVKHHNMSNLYEQAKTLKDKFLSFQISHVLREFNSEADAQANLAINLADGQIQEDLQ